MFPALQIGGGGRRDSSVRVSGKCTRAYSSICMTDGRAHSPLTQLEHRHSPAASASGNVHMCALAYYLHSPSSEWLMAQ